MQCELGIWNCNSTHLEGIRWRRLEQTILVYEDLWSWIYGSFMRVFLFVQGDRINPWTERDKIVWNWLLSYGDPHLLPHHFLNLFLFWRASLCGRVTWGSVCTGLKTLLGLIRTEDWRFSYPLWKGKESSTPITWPFVGHESDRSI